MTFKVKRSEAQARLHLSIHAILPWSQFVSCRNEKTSKIKQVHVLLAGKLEKCVQNLHFLSGIFHSLASFLQQPFGI